MRYKRSKKWFFMVLCMICLPSCWWVSHNKNEVVVINVLDEKLYRDCHIKGSINIPFEKIETKTAGQVDKNAHVVLYCTNYQCTASDYAAQKLCEQGFNKVSVYEGGMAEWFQKGLPVNGPHTSAYLKKICRQPPRKTKESIPIISTLELAQKMGIEKAA